MLQIRGHVQTDVTQKFEKGKEDKWPKHKAKVPKEDEKEDNDD